MTAGNDEDRRVADLDRHVADLEKILDVTRALGVAVDLDPLLAQIAAAATDVLDCERATVFLCDHAKGELFSRIATGMEGAPIEEIRFGMDKGIAGEVATTGKGVNIPDPYADPRFNPDFDRKSGFVTKSLLTLPLGGHDGKIVGVLQVLNKRGGPFGERDERLLSTLGAQAGVAIERQGLLEQYAVKQRIERDLNIAREIQQGLLPKAPPISPASRSPAGTARPTRRAGIVSIGSPSPAGIWRSRSATPPATGSARRWWPPRPERSFVARSCRAGISPASCRRSTISSARISARGRS